MGRVDIFRGYVSQFLCRRILTSEDKTGALHWMGVVGDGSVLIPVRGDVYN